MEAYILLCTALELKHTQIAKLLLTSNSNVNTETSNFSNSLLHFAILNDDVEIVRMLLDKGVNVENFNGKTALHNAVERMQTEIINTAGALNVIPMCLAIKKDSKEIINLLSSRANIDNNRSKSTISWSVTADPRKGCPPLHLAVKKGNEELTKFLLSKGADVNAIGTSGTTSLHIATEHGNLKIVEFLLKHGARVNSAYTSIFQEGYTPLHVAAEKGGKEIIELLLSRGADINAKGKDGTTPLHVATEKDNLNIVELLLKHGADIYSKTQRGGTPLCFAIESRHEKVVNVLLERGANIGLDDTYDKTMLHFAVEKGSSIIVEHILKHCPDLNNKRNSSVLKVAVKGWGTEYRKIIKNLLRYGFTVNPKDTKNFMYAAVKKGYLELIEELLKHGTGVNMLCNSTSGKGYIPLHVASIKNQVEVAKLLISYGADVNAEDANGETALYSATQRGREKIVELLLKCGAKADAKTKRDLMTPLHVAAVFGEIKIVELLLKLGASIDSIDKHGLTALHVATLKGQTEIVIALLEHGSDFTITSKTNYTALGFAIKTFCDETFGCNYDDDYRCGYDYDYEECQISTYAYIADILKRHIIKMRSANLYAGNEDVLSIPSPASSSNDEELSDSDDEDERRYKKRARRETRLSRNKFQSKCEKEIDKMKSEEVVNTNITFYDILSKDVNRLAMYARNRSIVEAFESDDYKKKFPIYGSMINNNFRKGERKKEFLEQSNKILYLLFTNIRELPRNCTERILSYLKENDLRALRDTDKPYASVKEKCAKRRRQS